jgi:hypothetical protein
MSGPGQMTPDLMAMMQKALEERRRMSLAGALLGNKENSGLPTAGVANAGLSGLGKMFSMGGS